MSASIVSQHAARGSGQQRRFGSLALTALFVLAHLGSAAAEMRQSGSLVRQAGEAHAGAPAAEQDRLPTTPIIDYTHVFANEAQPEPRR